MAKTFLDSIYAGLHEESPDNAEITLYWSKFFESLEIYTNPKYEKGDIYDHFSSIMCGLGRGERMQGFKRGLTLGLKLPLAVASEDRSHGEVEEEYRQLVRSVGLAR